MLLVRKEKYVYSVCCDVISMGMVFRVLCGVVGNIFVKVILTAVDIWIMIYYVYVTAERVERMREFLRSGVFRSVFACLCLDGKNV